MYYGQSEWIDIVLKLGVLYGKGYERECTKDKVLQLQKGATDVVVQQTCQEYSDILCNMIEEQQARLDGYKVADSSVGMIDLIPKKIDLTTDPKLAIIKINGNWK